MTSGGICEKCHGKRQTKCASCNGVGSLKIAPRFPGGPTLNKECEPCKHTGRLQCTTCTGTGKQP